MTHRSNLGLYPSVRDSYLNSRIPPTQRSLFDGEVNTTDLTEATAEKSKGQKRDWLQYNLKMESMQTKIVINISGEIFETYSDTLSRFPETLLGDKEMRGQHYCSQTGQYFFQRNRRCFESILHFYQSKGSLLCPIGIPVSIFEDECRFFGLAEAVITAMKNKEGIISSLEEKNVRLMDEKNSTFRERISHGLENPRSSNAAWIFAMSSLVVAFMSVFTASLETMQCFHSSANVWAIIDFVLNILLLLELIFRMVFAHKVLDFLKNSLNVMEIAILLIYFLLLLMHTNAMGFLGLFKTLKVMRVIRLLRVSKHSKRLIVVGKIMHCNLKNFGLVALCFVITVLIGSTFMFVIEEWNRLDGDDGGFTSIPASIWWSVQTVTTIGYGDLVPTSAPGKIFASSYMLIGVVALSLPVLTIVAHFLTVYPKNIQYDAYVPSL